MKKEYTVRQLAGERWFYEFTEPNKKGEKIVVELCKCEDCSFKDSIPKLWKKHGFMDRVLETYWSIQTYVTDTEGHSFMRYNPQIKTGKYEINFEWMFEATEENKQKLLNEVYRLASTTEGKTATEEKYSKIEEFAKNNNIEIYKEIPEGWQVTKNSFTAPYGSVTVCNMESFKSKKRKTGLLLN